MSAVQVVPAEQPPPRKVPSMSATAWKNTKVLAKKNFLVKRGQYCSLSCNCCPCALVFELFFPVGIIALFAYLKTLDPDSVTLPPGWQHMTEDDSFVPVPFTAGVSSTSASNFMSSILLPLHLRPKYKLALAAQDVADVAKVEEFRAWVTEQWYPRQPLPIVPCLPSERPGKQMEDEGRRSNRGRRHLQDVPTPGMPYTTHVTDLLDKYTWYDVAEEQTTADWIPTCDGQDTAATEWDCGATDVITCNTMPGCGWKGEAVGGTCAASAAFPPESLCCSRGPDDSESMPSLTEGGNETPVTQPGWISSFSDITVVYGDGTANALDQYIESSTYLTDDSPFIFAAIVFDKVPADGAESPKWEYSIRTNSTWVDTELNPDPDEEKVAYTASVDELLSSIGNFAAYLGYSFDDDVDTSEGPQEYAQIDAPSFASLQQLVDRYLIKTPAEGISTATAIVDNGLIGACPTLDCDQVAAPLKYEPYRVIMSTMPFASTSTYPFYAAIADYLPVLFIVIYLYAVFNAAQTFILEKETKAREGLRMQGVGNCTLIASWYVSLGATYFVMALLMAIASKASLFAQSSFVLVLLGYWLCLVSFMSFSFFTHTFFSKARTGGLFNVIVFTASFMLWSNVSGVGVSKFYRFLGLLHPGTACCFLIELLCKFEGAATGVTFGSLFTPVSGATYGGTLSMLVFDMVIYTILGYYFELVLPKEFGTRLSPYFMCTKEYWNECCGGSSSSTTVDATTNQLRPIVPQLPGDSAHNVEPLGPSEVLLQNEQKGIEISGLRKEFKTPDGLLVAVDRLSLTMVEGQIFALLGHNGAGKTTAINMLSGIYKPTAGDAKIYGKSVTRHMGDIRNFIGTCFQHDVLYPDLSVYDHIAMYAQLKGIPSAEISTKADEIIQAVGLTEKRHTKSSALSGGMKRKLSLCIALVGGKEVSKVLFLDEPTSGMDPYSRRSTWNMLQSSREGRTIILTTHFMEEADMLGDRIGIMGKGKLLCCGTSMYLKKKHGAGYSLTIETETECDEAAISDLVKQHVPNFLVQSSVGKEKSFQLPMADSPTFPALFTALDQQKAKLGVVDYGMSVTTMESVFLKVITEDSAGKNELTKPTAGADSASPGGFSSLEATTASRDKQGSAQRCCKHIFALYMKRFHYGRRDKNSIICNTVIPLALLTLSMQFLTSAMSLQTTPPMRMDFETAFGVPNTVIPVHTTVTTEADKATALTKVPGSQVWPELENADTGKIFGVDYTDGCPATAGGAGDDGIQLWSAGCDGTWFGAVSSSSYNEVLTSSYSQEGGADQRNAELLAGPTLSMALDIYDHSMAASNVDDVTFGAIVATGDAPGVSILLNTSARYSGPVMLNALSNGYAKDAVDGMTIAVSNAPLPITGAMDKALNQVQNITAVLFIVIAFSFLPGATIAFVVKEREASHNSKHQQMISGVSISGYWVASFLWDATLYCIPLALSMIIIHQYDLRAFTGSPCYDWNTTSTTYNPFVGDFFMDSGAANCSDVIDQHGAEQGLLQSYGSCDAKDPTNAEAVTACSSVTIVGENVEWNTAACMMAGYAPDEWEACMADADCRAELDVGMAPGATIGNEPPSVWDLDMSQPRTLTLVFFALIEQMQLGAEDQCVYTPVFMPKPYCDALNEYELSLDRPGTILPCDARLADVCQVTTDTCPISRSAAVFLLFLGYGLSIIVWSYCLSHLFSTHTTAQVYSILLCFITGLVLMLVSLILDIAFENPNIAATNSTLKWFYRMLSPGFCLGNGMLTMAFSAIGVVLGGDSGTEILIGTYNPLGWNNAGRDIVFLFLSVPLFLGITIMLDIIKSYPKIAGVLFKDKVVEDPPFDVDEDVQAEQERVISGGAKDDAIRLEHIRKVYNKGENRGCCSGEQSRPKVAVRDLSFGVPKGECFGFLGINGAGKTSTMNMLTGNFLPSSGDAWLYGLDIKTQQLEVRAKLGYCPQHDALLDLLTVREHLQLFGRIKGVPDKDLSHFVEAVIIEMDLTNFANKLAGQLSGGNKRKLSVGIATIGRPPIVFLDEPSTGMDPVARRFMWDVIERISQQDSQCAVVLTTHSMEECEALCGRVGIMVGGRLRCLGSAQHLKGRFGQGYQFEVKLVTEDNDEIEALVQASELEQNITAQNVGNACAILGDASIAAHIKAQDPVGHDLYHSFLPSGPGAVSLAQFTSWFKAQERAKRLIGSITEKWSDARLVERHGRHLRFQLGSTDGIQLADVFTFAEQHRATLGIDDYAVSQTSLEQIFNSFASQQEEETSGVRGIVSPALTANVTVPSGLSAGDKFQVTVGGVQVEVAVPDGCGSGSVLAVPVPPRAAP